MYTCPKCHGMETLCCRQCTIAPLLKDQEDWRKGVELIASALGEKNPPDLSCVRIANIALEMRAKLEAVGL